MPETVITPDVIAQLEKAVAKYKEMKDKASK